MLSTTLVTVVPLWFAGGAIGSYLDRHGVPLVWSLLVSAVWLAWCVFLGFRSFVVGLWLGGRWEVRAHRRAAERAMAEAAQDWEILP